MGLLRVTGLSAAVALGAMLWALHAGRRADLPEHLLHQPTLIVDELLSPETGAALRQLAKEMRECVLHGRLAAI